MTASRSRGRACRSLEPALDRALSREFTHPTANSVRGGRGRVNARYGGTLRSSDRADRADRELRGSVGARSASRGWVLLRDARNPRAYPPAHSVFAGPPSSRSVTKALGVFVYSCQNADSHHTNAETQFEMQDGGWREVCVIGDVEAPDYWGKGRTRPAATISSLPPLFLLW